MHLIHGKSPSPSRAAVSLSHFTLGRLWLSGVPDMKLQTRWHPAFIVFIAGYLRFWKGHRRGMEMFK
ncbi:hypothetical protein D9611_000613 [Ephemerocybe angulata]|uniref:Uncharacterized protein n=1 Tax=Ephemerocybe angulata TaxID=980116 RepID=A0A8H5BNW2_9AGAR|nr:hypothetical protein D9611_000613 [Tulosesus angulatus]